MPMSPIHCPLGLWYQAHTEVDERLPYRRDFPSSGCLKAINRSFFLHTEFYYDWYHYHIQPVFVQNRVLD